MTWQFKILQEHKDCDWKYWVRNVSLHLQEQTLLNLWYILNHWAIINGWQVVKSVSAVGNGTDIPEFDGPVDRKVSFRNGFELSFFMFGLFFAISWWAWVEAEYLRWPEAVKKRLTIVWYFFREFCLYPRVGERSSWRCSEIGKLSLEDVFGVKMVPWNPPQCWSYEYSHWRLKATPQLCCPFVSWQSLIADLRKSSNSRPFDWTLP